MRIHLAPAMLVSFGLVNAPRGGAPAQPQCADDFEPNDTPETARDLGEVGLDQPITQTATLHTETDVDHFKLRALEAANATCTGRIERYQVALEVTAPLDVGGLRLIAGTREVLAKPGESASLVLEFEGKCAAKPDQFEVRFQLDASADPTFSCTPYSLKYAFRERP